MNNNRVSPQEIQMGMRVNDLDGKSTLDNTDVHLGLIMPNENLIPVAQAVDAPKLMCAMCGEMTSQGDFYQF